MKRNAVNANTAERWLEKLEKGRVLKEGWPKYLVRLTRSGSLEVKYQSTDPDSIEREAQRFKNMGLVEGVHFTVKMPEGGKAGYVSILKLGLAYAAYLSVRGSKTQRELAAEFVELILKRAENEGNDVLEKAKEIIDEGRSWGSLTLKDFKRVVEVGNKTYFVHVEGGKAFEEEQNGKTLLRIKIKAEVGRVEGGQIKDLVESEYIITFGRYGDNNKAMGFIYASADAPGGREADAERFSALVEALTGKKPTINHKKNKIQMVCYGGHLEGFMRYAELVETIIKWLVETSRR
jgi:hypothetical protein